MVCIRLPQACGGALSATSQMSLLDSEGTYVKMLGEEDRKPSVSSLHSSCNGLAFIPEGERRREPDPVHPGGRSNSRPSTIQNTYIAITVYQGGLPKGGHRLDRGLARGHEKQEELCKPEMETSVHPTQGQLRRSDPDSIPLSFAL